MDALGVVKRVHRLLATWCLLISLPVGTSTNQPVCMAAPDVYPLPVLNASLKLGVFWTASAKVMGHIARILLQEHLGVQTEIQVLTVGYNPDLDRVLGDENCSEPPGVQLSFEVWPTPEFYVKRTRCDWMVTDTLAGIMARVGFYMPKHLTAYIFNKTGLPIYYYETMQSGRRPWIQGNTSLFSRTRDVAINDSRPCCGIQQIPCDADGWFYPQACAHAKDECIPLLAYSAYAPAVCQIVMNLNLPLAVRVAKLPFANMARKYNLSFFWFQPDMYDREEFYEQIVLPPHDAIAWKRKQYDTAPIGTQLRKAAWSKLQSEAPQVWHLFTQLTITDAEMDGIMENAFHMTRTLTGSLSHNIEFQVACDWVKKNLERLALPSRSCSFDWRPGRGCICEPGKRLHGNNVSCEACPAGTVNPVVGGLCVDCQEGRYAGTQGQTECTKCPVGTYQNASRSSTCIDCPKLGTKLVTELPESSNPTLCRCPANFYYSHVHEVCLRCPIGLHCPGGFAPFAAMNRTDASPQLLDGYMVRMFSSRLEVFKCHYSTACPKNRSVFMISGQLNEAAMCSYGAGVSCGACPLRHAWAGANCKLCEGGYRSTALVVFALQITVCLICFGIAFGSMRPPSAVRAAFGTILAFGQALLVLWSFHIICPAQLQALGLSLKIFQMDLQSMGIPLGCVIGSGLFERHLYSVLWPLSFVVGLLGIRILSILWSKCTNFLVARSSSIHKLLEFTLDDMINAITWIHYVFYMVHAKCALGLVQHVRHPCGRTTFFTYPDVIVDAQSQTFAFAWLVSAMALTVYAIGYFSRVAYVVSVAPKKFHSDPGFRRRNRCIWSAFNPTLWWFSVVHLSYCLLLNCSVLLSQSSRIQLLSASIVHAAYILVACHFPPWKFAVNHICDLICKITLFVLVVVTSASIGVEEAELLDKKSHSNLMLGTAGLPCLLLFAITARYIFNSKVAQVKSLKIRCEFAERFYDIVTIVGRMPFLELRHFATELLDNDIAQLDTALEIMQETLLGLQSEKLWHWRCMATEFRRAVPGSLEGERIARGVGVSDDYCMLARKVLKEAQGHAANLSKDHPIKDESAMSRARSQITGIDKEAVQVFRLFDASGDGQITQDAFVSALIRKIDGSSNFTREDLENVYKYINVDGGDGLSLVEITHALRKIVEPIRPAWMREAIWKEFKRGGTYDVDECRAPLRLARLHNGSITIPSGSLHAADWAAPPPPCKQQS